MLNVHCLYLGGIYGAGESIAIINWLPARYLVVHKKRDYRLMIFFPSSFSLSPPHILSSESVLAHQ